MLFAGNALAGTSSSKDCGVCQTQPAQQVTTTNSSSSSTSTTHIRVVKTVRAQVRQYEQVTHRIVTIDQRPGGVKSLAGCVDPIQKGWIKNGGQFSNTRYKGGAGRFWDRWHAGLSICHPHRIKWNGGYWMEGTKSNCSNEKIRIQVSGPRKIHKIIPVIRFRTVKSFRSTYDKFIKKHTESTSTSTTTTSYSCAAYGDGWTLDGSVCKKCPPPCPPPSKAHAFLAKTALKDGVNVALSGGEFSFSITVNGSASGSTTNAASGQSRDLGQFNPGDSVQVCETNTGGYTPDQVCISHTMAAGENFTFSFTNRKTTPPPSNCVTITSTIDLNDVPIGKNSGQLPFKVNSCGSGSVTIDPGNGAISKCDSTTPQASVSFDLVAGDNSFCVIYYAPNDSTAKTGSITYTAIQGSAKDVKVDNFDITQPTRP